MPRTTKNEILEKNITAISKKISTLSDKIILLEKDLSRTQKLIQQDMKKLISMVRDQN
jgi:hypothetical protein|tara:strand:+ start:941 stop:1114 length:174 start_codon:yes stop_codon:yes gene_type:complete